ncbi:unnamed protein product, partial [Phaeothamnion confervicola]
MTKLAATALLPAAFIPPDLRLVCMRPPAFCLQAMSVMTAASTSLDEKRSVLFPCNGPVSDVLSKRTRRRQFLSSILGTLFLFHASRDSAAARLDDFVVVFGDGRIGLELGDKPASRLSSVTVVIRQVRPSSQAAGEVRLQPGLGIAAVNGENVVGRPAKEVAMQIASAARPLEITFCDAQSPPPSSSQLTVERAPRGDEISSGGGAMGSNDAPANSAEPGLVVSHVRDGTGCATKTRAGDFIEIRFTARLADDMAVEVDSSDRRGTGLPFALVLGNGEVVKGLDLALFDMCIGERRRIEVPPRLAFGSAGSKAFGVPPGARLIYGVELVSINLAADGAAARGD